jgi:hypothetical protein
MRRSFCVFVLLLSLVAGISAVVSPAVAAQAVGTRDAGVTVVNSDATGQVSRFDVDGNALDARDGEVASPGVRKACSLVPASSCHLVLDVPYGLANTYQWR